MAAKDNLVRQELNLSSVIGSEQLNNSASSEVNIFGKKKAKDEELYETEKGVELEESADFMEVEENHPDEDVVMVI